MDCKQKTIYLGTAMTTAPVKTEPAYPQIGRGPVYLAQRDKNTEEYREYLRLQKKFKGID